MRYKHKEDIHTLCPNRGIQNSPNIHQYQPKIKDKRHRNSGSRIYGSPCNSSKTVNRCTLIFARERILDNKHIPPGRVLILTLLDTIQKHCEIWQTHRKNYSNAVKSWKRYAKRMILLTWEGTDRWRDWMTLENFYDAIYNILNNSTNHAMTAITLKQLKAKITRLRHLEEQWIFVDDEHDMIEGEEPSPNHLI